MVLADVSTAIRGSEVVGNCGDFRDGGLERAESVESTVKEAKGRDLINPEWSATIVV